MKIILQIPDQTPAPTSKSVTKSASATLAPAMSPEPPAEPPAATPEPKSTQPTTPGKRDDIEQQSEAEDNSVAEASSNSLHSFENQGGINNISDPDVSKPGVFRFVAPRGDA